MKRSHQGRQSSWMRRKPLGTFSRAQRKRKTYSFERLEDRFYFSATPVEMQTVSLSSSTPDGAAAIWLRELQWAAIQAADATNSVPPQYTVMALPNDPLFEDQWHLLNTGQIVGNPNDPQILFGVAGEDINVVPVWNLGYTGEGVLVAVIDTGVQLGHPDLTGNIHPTLRFNAITGTNNASPSLFDPVGGHGTAVAGLVGAVWNNGQGGTGVAPGVTLVPIRIGIGLLDNPNIPFDQQISNALQFAIQNGVDITNNSWGPNHAFNRAALPLTTTELDLLRDSVIFGRDGLGMIHVFSSGNDGGPAFSEGFEGFGNYDSASYNPWVNSRYTIGVTGVDHDGLYINTDGTFTSYPNAGASVLVAAPTGSNVAQTVADDSGQGSGLWTTDLTGEFGFNAAPLPGGSDLDRDLLADPDYTSRFNGTSGAAPIVSGVIALMLDANPNLTYRDVQEILLRSARQNAQFEFPASGGLGGALASQNTWQTNQIGPFRNPDPWIINSGQDPIESLFNPLADPNIDGIFFGGQVFAPDGSDGGRQFSSHYEPQPGLFTNSAGYTVSQGYGVYSEQIGYAHGVVDAELAIKMAEQWHTLDQNLDRLTEKTFTTFVVQTAARIPAAEETVGPPDGPAMLVPGGWFGLGGYIDFWNEYFADDDPAVPDDGPFADYDGPPAERRGDSYIDFAVPPNEAINVEWVEVRVDITGPAEDLEFLRIMLTSPDGTQSELNHYYADPDFIPFSLQPISAPAGAIDPAGDIDVNGGSFVWTFSTNRNWGESTNTSVIIDPVTGEPLFSEDPFTGLPNTPIFRDWELHVENWSNSEFIFAGVEVVWHGKPIEGGALDPNWNVAAAQRVQGFVGLDTNNDEKFNYSRYIQSLADPDGDPDSIRLLDVTRQLDFTDTNANGVYDPAFDIINQEPFAENVLVEAFRVDPETGVVDDDATARFLTGADGNYYFDLDPTFEYEIRITDPLDRIQLTDVDTLDAYQRHYREVWRITPDWFFAPDRDNPLVAQDNPGEIFFGTSDANDDGIMTDSPLPYLELGAPVPMAVRNINFLLKEDAPVEEFDVAGTVYADLNGNGAFDGNDVPAPGIFVYQDVNRNGNPDAGEQRIETDANGQYLLTIPADHVDTYAVGVIPPTVNWIPTDPGGDGVEDVFAGPGSPTQNVNFFLDPPNDAFPDAGANEKGDILGVVFSDLDKDGVRDADENGLANIRVFIDADENGVWNSATETSVLTSSTGGYFFADVDPGLHRIDVHIENEFQSNAAWELTQPASGFRSVNLGPGGTVQGVTFGLANRADRDWGDLLNSYQTSAAANGPSHFVVPGFRLGSAVDGEVDGVPSAGANSDDLVGDTDNGVAVISNGGVLQPGANTLQVTVFGIGGLLTGWIDWDGDGQFEDATERLLWNGDSEADLNPGTSNLQITAPANAVNGQLAARFRWGEAGLSFNGPAVVGEVEDYLLAFASSAVSGLDGDYNDDGTVDQADYIVWRKNNGTNNTMANDPSPGMVNSEDWTTWRAHFGETAGEGAGAGAGQALVEDSTPSNQPIAPQVVSEPAGSSLETSGVGQSVLVITPTVHGPVAVHATPSQSSDATVSVSPLFAVVTADAGSSTSSAPDVRVAHLAGSAGVVASSDANLLLLDQVWAELDDDSADDAPLCDRFGVEDDDAAGSLALAAVFEDESNWWAM